MNHSISRVLARDTYRAACLFGVVFTLAFILIVILNLGPGGLAGASFLGAGFLGQTAVTTPGARAGAGGTPQPAVVAALPFTASAHEHTEPAFTVTVTPGASQVQVNPQDIPAYGYIRHIWLEVIGAGGAGGTGLGDYPWNILSGLTFQDVNGATIFGPIDGYAAMIANLVGGYSFNNNPANAPFFAGSAPNPAFYLRIPVEISSRDALGALSNQNAAANYKLAMAINTIAATTSVAYTTPPTLTIRAYLEAWTLPAPTNNRNQPQAQVPPLLGTGQYWSSTNRAVVQGNNTLPVTRVGNLIRNIVLIGRDNAGVRTDAVFPDPVVFNWDGNQIHNASVRYFTNYFFEKVGGAFTRPVGVLVLPFSHAATGRLGNDTPDLWLPTTSSSRLELSGNSAVAGTVQMLVNEVAPVEISQAERFQVPSDTGAVAA